MKVNEEEVDEEGVGEAEVDEKVDEKMVVKNRKSADLVIGRCMKM